MLMTLLAIVRTVLGAGMPDVQPADLAPYEHRCGWLLQRGTDRYSFRDVEADWTIVDPTAPGMPEGWAGPPEFRPGWWTETGDGGHGCVCAELSVSVGARMVLRVLST